MAGWADWLSGLSGWKPPSYEDVTGSKTFGGDWAGAASGYGANLMSQYGSSLSPQAQAYLRNKLSGFGDIALLENLAQGNANPQTGNIAGMMQSYLSGLGGGGSNAFGSNPRAIAQAALDKLAQMRGQNAEGYGFYSAGGGRSDLLNALGASMGAQTNPFADYLRGLLGQAYQGYQSDFSNATRPGDWISYVLSRVKGSGLNYGGGDGGAGIQASQGPGYGAAVSPRY